MDKILVEHSDILDRISFTTLFSVWIGMALVFGAIHYLFSFSVLHGLLYNSMKIGQSWSDFIVAQYFSFSAAALGFQAYGVLPLGLSRVFAIIEVVGGWALFSIVVSKLLSRKQEVLLQEVYTISFEEKIHRLRSAMSLFRSDVGKLIEKIDSGAISQRRIDDLWITFATLESTLYEVTRMMQPSGVDKYVKTIDDFNLELVLNSVGMSLAKASDLLAVLNNKNFIWHSSLIHSTISAAFISVTTIQKLVKKRDANQKILEKMDDVVALAEQLRHQTQVVVRAEASLSD